MNCIRAFGYVLGFGFLLAVACSAQETETRTIRFVLPKNVPGWKTGDIQNKEDIVLERKRESTKYVVQPGDTLAAIAADHNVTVEELAEANGIANPDLIQVGQELDIPSDGVDSEPSKGPNDDASDDKISEVAIRVGRSVAQAESGGRYDSVHDDTGRLNFGIGSWTNRRVADVLESYRQLAEEQGKLDELYAIFGGKAKFEALLKKINGGGQWADFTKLERNQLKALGRKREFQRAQDEHLARDISAELKRIRNNGYPFVEVWGPRNDNVESISEIAAHVLVHAAHQRGPSGLKKDIALLKSTLPEGYTEMDLLRAIADRVVSKVKPKYRRGVRARYDRLFRDFASSTDRHEFDG